MAKSEQLGIVAILEEEISSVQQEIDRLKKSVERIGVLQAELTGMKMTLARFREKGANDLKEDVQRPDQTPLQEILGYPPISSAYRENSIPSMTYEILTQAGKPLRGDEIVAAIATRGRIVTKDVVLGALYRDMKKNHVFRLVMPGVFGLKQWGEEARS